MINRIVLVGRPLKIVFNFSALHKVVNHAVWLFKTFPVSHVRKQVKMLDISNKKCKLNMSLPILQGKTLPATATVPYFKVNLYLCLNESRYYFLRLSCPEWIYWSSLLSHKFEKPFPATICPPTSQDIFRDSLPHIPIGTLMSCLMYE